MNVLTHDEIKDLKYLQRRRGRRETGHMIVEGAKIIQECISENIEIHRIVFSEEMATNQEVLDKYAQWSHLFAILPDTSIHSLSKMDTFPGILAEIAIPLRSFSDIESAEKVACFIGIGDPGNLGTMIRTADWFGYSAILLGGDGVDMYNEKVVRSTMGSIFRMNIYTSENPLNDLKHLQKTGFSLISTDAHGKNATPDSDKKTCVIMGNESHGLAKEYIDIADSTYTIPRSGSAESLNVAVSFGIVLFDLNR